MRGETPTTFEMDGLFDEKDIADRFFVMKPCSECAKYSRHDLRTESKCPYCKGKISPNGRYWYSLRTWTGKILTAADKKKLGV